MEVSIGRILHESETIQATEGLAVRLIERAKALRATKPKAAREILRSIEASPLRVVEINLIERIGAGWADVDSIILALETRDTLLKSAGDELNELIKEGGYAAGVAAAILNDEREWKSILEKNDAKAQLALLASARYMRDKLPVEIVGRLLNSPNRALAKAAESYLEIEDSPEARKSILARHPGEAYILGDITAINVSDIFSYVELARNWENTLRKEIQDRNGPEAIYAVARIDSGADYPGVIIRVRGGNAELSVHKTPGRREVRRLTGGELDELKNFTSRPEIEDLGPESFPEEGEWRYEYLRLTKEGGRRIVFGDLRRAPKDSTLHEELSGLFYRLSRSGEFITRYDIEDKIPGVEVVLADRNLSALKVCAEGNEILALIVEKGIEYRQGGSKAGPEWREFSSGKPGEVRDEPSACRNPNTPSEGASVFASGGEDGGIWKSEPGMEPVRVASGNYFNAIITPDGRWLVSNKLVADEGKTAPRLIRHNLQSGEEYALPMPQNFDSPTLIYVAAHGKVLAGSYGFGEINNGYLIDPETGTVQPVNGELGPLIDSLAYPLQQGAAPNLFWAAIYDREKKGTKLGRYDSKNFVFTPLLEIPELALRNDNIWVDEAGGKIWFVYQGHLLRIPLPLKSK